jgi:4,5-DOPA dioxygenase extradiol
MKMPTLFISHGSPMHAIDAGGAGSAWRAIADSMPKPRAVLIASAHWETTLPMLTGAANLQTIHDFGGFPDELYRVRYDATGSPQLAQQAANLLRDAGLSPSVNACRGIDHGAWVPLRWMYPERDVPVVQLSIQPALGPAHHLALGRALVPLTDHGVLVIGSGHVTHNLRDWSVHRNAAASLPYVAEFSEWLADKLAAHDEDALVDYRSRAPHAARAHPTDEHFLPLFIALGAAGENPRVQREHAAIDAAALAMDAYSFGMAA